MQKITATLVRHKDTKRTIVYKENVDEGMERVGNIYIPKMVLGNPAPERLTLTLEVEA